MHGLIDKYLEFQDRTFYKYGNYAIAILASIVAIFLLILWLLSTNLYVTSGTENNPNNAEERTLPAVNGKLFVCDGGKSIDATLDDSKARLHLSDGRDITLPRV